jgi:hypothetical protein
LKEETVRAIKEKARTWKEFKSSLIGPGRKCELEAKMKEVSALCKKTIQRAKRLYKGKVAQQHDPRLLYGYVNESSMVRPRIGLLVGKNSEMIMESKEVAEELSSLYQTVFRQETLPMQVLRQV